MKDRIASLLGSGLAPALVASATGVSASYISQLLSEPAFSLEVASLRAKDIEKMQERDGAWDGLEDKLLEKLGDLVPFMVKPREVLHAIQVVNGAKRRAADLVKPDGSALGSVTNHNTVVLVLPQKVVSQFELSKNNEVISVAGRALVPMATSRLLEEIKDKQEKAPEEKSPSPAPGENDYDPARDQRLSDARPESRDNFSPEIAERIVSAELV